MACKKKLSKECYKCKQFTIHNVAVWCAKGYYFKKAEELKKSK